jgi:hypothetical protein
MPVLKVKDGDSWKYVFGGGDKSVAVDTNLKNSGQAADAKVVGEKFENCLTKDDIPELAYDLYTQIYADVSNDLSDLSDHTSNKENPHQVTKKQVGLEFVENKSSATIRSELTTANVTKALGYTPPTSDRTMVREFNSGPIREPIFSHDKDLAKIYTITIEEDSSSYYTVVVDYYAIVNGFSSFRLGGSEYCLNAQLSGTTVTFSTEANMNIVLVCGYY